MDKTIKIIVGKDGIMNITPERARTGLFTTGSTDAEEITKRRNDAIIMLDSPSNPRVVNSVIIKNEANGTYFYEIELKVRTMPEMVNVMDKHFPDYLAVLDEASHSRTVGKMAGTTFGHAESLAMTSNCAIRIVAAWDFNEELDHYSTYIGLDETDEVCFFNLSHATCSWDGLTREEQGGVPLQYDMRYKWNWLDGPMGDDFWELLDTCVRNSITH